MPTYRIQFYGNTGPGNAERHEIGADAINYSGHESTFMDFIESTPEGDRLLLRVRTSDVEYLELVER